jgi:hypothetical protein
MNKLSPIILFAYNRPWHVKQTVEALKNNFLADQSELFIYSDGPKAQEDHYKVNEVRNFLYRIDGFKVVKIIESSENKGLAQNIISGVTETVNHHGRIIVLEDDLVTSPYFLQYMNESLERYKNDPVVMHIAGYMLPVETENLPETFFYRAPSCWGWGTWQDSWRLFEKNPGKLMKIFSAKQKRSFNLDGCHDFWAHLKANKTGKWETWAIFWYASIHLNRGLCLHPSVSMVRNIGHDGTGSHCRESEQYNVKLSEKPIRYYEKNLHEHQEAVHRIKEFYKKMRSPFATKIVQKVKCLLNIKR